MANILTIVLAVFMSFSAFADGPSEDSSKYYYDFLTKKTLDDFQEGVKNYNEKKEASAPAIKKGKSFNYNIVIKNINVHFTVLNYLNDQMYVNDRLVQRSTFGLKKTTWINPLVSDAIADDDVTLDGETTKILLTALGGLANNLEEVGMMCFMGCVKDVKKNNKQKILNTLERQHDICNDQLYAQEDTLKKYPSYNMVSLLHSTFNPEFVSIRNLIQKISESNAKKVKDFMANKMVVTKNYQTCVGVMTSGTVADGAADAMEKGASILVHGGVTSMTIEEEVEKAKAICVKMDELKTCLVTLKKNLNTINSIKRSVNKGGYNVPLETLPDIKSISK